MNNISPVVSIDNQPGKSLGLGVMLAVFLGPVGLLYSRPLAGIVMAFVCALAWGTPLVGVMWVCAVMMAPYAVMRHNRRISLS